MNDATERLLCGLRQERIRNLSERIYIELLVASSDGTDEEDARTAIRFAETFERVWEAKERGYDD